MTYLLSAYLEGSILPDVSISSKNYDLMVATLEELKSVYYEVQIHRLQEDNSETLVMRFVDKQERLYEVVE